MEPFELGDGAEAETMVLDGRHRNHRTHRGRRDRTRGQFDGHRSRHRVRPLLLIAVIFAISFLIKMIILNALAPASPSGDESGATAPPADAVPEGEASDTRLAALRQTLDANGYHDVRFRMNGDTLELWGTVPDELDRINVQTLIFRTTGIIALDDRLQVREVDAEP